MMTPARPCPPVHLTVTFALVDAEGRPLTLDSACQARLMALPGAVSLTPGEAGVSFIVFHLDPEQPPDLPSLSARLRRLASPVRRRTPEEVHRRQ